MGTDLYRQRAIYRSPNGILTLRRIAGGRDRGQCFVFAIEFDDGSGATAELEAKEVLELVGSLWCALPDDDERQLEAMFHGDGVKVEAFAGGPDQGLCIRFSIGDVGGRGRGAYVEWNIDHAIDMIRKLWALLPADRRPLLP